MSKKYGNYILVKTGGPSTMVQDLGREEELSNRGRSYGHATVDEEGTELVEEIRFLNLKRHNEILANRD